MKTDTARTLLAVLGWLLAVLNSPAQTRDENGVVTLTGGLNSNAAYELELSVHYCPLPWVGIGGGLGMFKQMEAEYYPSTFSLRQDMERPGEGQDYWCIDDDYEKLSNFYLRPSLLLTSPRLFAIRDWQFRLYAEPGVILTLPYDRVAMWHYSPGCNPVCESHGSGRGPWVFPSLKGGLKAGSDEVQLSLGLAFSTLDIYAQRRHIRFPAFDMSRWYPSRSGTLTLLASISVAL